MTHIKNNRGEAYIDVLVTLMIFIMMAVFFLNIFSFFIIKQDMDYMAKQLLAEATTGGRISENVLDRQGELEEDTKITLDSVCWTADYFNTPEKTVQLGNTIHLEIRYITELKGFGVFKIPITLSKSCSGNSQRYWT